MAERRTHTEFWVVFGLLLAVVLVTQLAPQGPLAMGRSGQGLQLFSLLSGGRRATDGAFRGANVGAVMGGSTLDLRRATLAPGEEAVIDVLAVLGGVVIRVPDGWVVDTKALPVFGGVSDQRGRRARTGEAEPSGEGPQSPRLVLHGAILMGALTISS